MRISLTTETKAYSVQYNDISYSLLEVLYPYGHPSYILCDKLGKLINDKKLLETILEFKNSLIRIDS